MMRWEVIADLVKAYGWTQGAELGVLKGETFLYLLGRCPDLHLVGVDTFRFMANQVYSDDGSTYRSHDFADHYARVLREMKPYGDRAELLVMTTRDAAAFVMEDNRLDFVFIDADHTFEAVIEDVVRWSSKLKPRGWFIGHDTHFPTVRRAIDIMLPGWTGHDDHVWAIPYAETVFARHH